MWTVLVLRRDETALPLIEVQCMCTLLNGHSLVTQWDKQFVFVFSRPRQKEILERCLGPLFCQRQLSAVSDYS